MKRILLLAGALFFTSGSAIAANPKKGPAITGREVLLVAVDRNGQLGIYGAQHVGFCCGLLRPETQSNKNTFWE